MDSSESDLANNTTLNLNSDPIPSTSTQSPSQSQIQSQTQTQTQTQTQALADQSSSSSSSSSKKKYPPDYFSLEDIMSLSQKVTCTFLKDIPNAGFLDISGDSETIHKGTKLEIPLWMAEHLHAEGYIEMSMPKGYNLTYREILEADANVVNLNKLGPNYYQLGQHLARMGLDESEDVANSLTNTFLQRFHKLLNYSLSATDDTINEILSFNNQLDNKEKEIFECGRKSVEEIKNWNNRNIEKITANEMVINLKKRKRALMEDKDYD